MSFIDQRWQHHRQRFSADYDTASHQHHHHHHHHPMASADSSFDTEPDTSIAPPPPSSSTSSSSAASATNATAAKQQPLERSKGDMLYQDLHPDGTPRRPMNAFMIFARHMRKNIQEESPGLKTGEISKRLSDDWKNLDSVSSLVSIIQINLLPGFSIVFLFLRHISTGTKRIFPFPRKNSQG